MIILGLMMRFLLYAPPCFIPISFQFVKYIFWTFKMSQNLEKFGNGIETLVFQGHEMLIRKCSGYPSTISATQAQTQHHTPITKPSTEQK